MKRLSTYKNRYYLVLILIPPLVIMSWKITISQTVNNYTQISELRTNASKYQNAETVLITFKTQLENLMEAEPLNPEQVDEMLLELISTNLNRFNIILETIPERENNAKSSYTIHTYKFSFSGRYVTLLKFIDFLESELRYGSVISIQFHRTEQRKTGEKLFADIYYQLVFNNI